MGKRLGVSEDYLATGSERGEDGATLLDAEIAMRLDEYAEAEQLYKTALEGATGSEERARALAGLGQLAFRAGRPREAIARLEEARRTAPRALPDHAGWADTLGRSYAMVDELEAAISIFRDSFHAAEEGEDAIEGVRFAVLLANALIDKGEYTEAVALLGRALELGPESSDPIFQARVYWSHSRLHALQNDTRTAARFARKALNILDLTEHTYYSARARQLLAHIELDRKHPEEALELIRNGIALLGESGTKVDHALFGLEEARALLQLGERERAAAVAMESAGLLADASPFEAGRGYTIVADVFEELGDLVKARELYELAAELLQPAASRYVLEVYQKLAQLLEAEGRKDEALDVLKKAVAFQAEPSA